MERTHALDRWLYRGKRPNRLARLINGASARLAAAVIGPAQLVMLEVAGRRTGKTISLPVVVADYQGERYAMVQRIACYGTHEGEFSGVRPTGEQVNFQIIEINRGGADGRVCRALILGRPARGTAPARLDAGARARELVVPSQPPDRLSTVRLPAPPTPPDRCSTHGRLLSHLPPSRPLTAHVRRI